MVAGSAAPIARGSSLLPDHRAYELVSPPGKEGNDVIADSSRTRAAADGNAASYESLGGFADVQGTGISVDYLSERSHDPHPDDNGWTTHAITPKQEPMSLFGPVFGLEPLWEGEFSGDLSRGVFRAWSPLTDVPNVAGVENLYLRQDLRTSGPGSYRLLSDCPACSAPLPTFPFPSLLPRLAGASADFSHVIFESAYPLADGAGFFQPNLYEWVDGTVSLVGQVPSPGDTACGGSGPPCNPVGGATAGQGTGSGAIGRTYTLRTISTDGSRIFFSSGGSLYMRIDGTTTIQLNATEKTVPDSPQPAAFETASVDGSRVFFTTTEQLTDDDTDTTVDLYMYDANASAGQHLTRLSVDGEPGDDPSDVQGVLGASTDGRSVYFVAQNQLVPGKPLHVRGIYLWREDSPLAYVGELAEPADLNMDALNKDWGFFQLSSRVTPDGGTLLFVSTNGEGLTGYDHGHSCSSGSSGCPELYVYTAATQHLACASCSPSGAPATTDATASISARTQTGAALYTWHLNHALSDDGRRAFFNTREALVPEDSNGKTDVYEYDVPAGTLHLISGGSDPADSWFLDATPSGNDVFFQTRQRLVGWDTDQNSDLYDARVGGGFPDPAPVPPSCGGDACQGPLGAAPGAPAAAGSATYRRPVAAAPVKAKTKAVKCRRGFKRKRVRGKVRCVKQRRRSGAKRSASHTRVARRAR